MSERTNRRAGSFGGLARSLGQTAGGLCIPFVLAFACGGESRSPPASEPSNTAGRGNEGGTAGGAENDDAGDASIGGETTHGDSGAAGAGSPRGGAEGTAASGGTSVSSDGGVPGDAGSTQGGAAGGHIGAAGSINAPQLRVTRVSLYQTLEIPLLEAGLGVTEKIPVIAGKAGLLRVFVEPSGEFMEQDVTAVLGISPLPSRQNQKRIFRASTTEQLTSTFNFPLRGDEIHTDGRLSLRLETASGEVLGQFPGEGEASLGAQVMVPLRLRVVPIIVDGSPVELGPAILERFRQRLLDLYPISDVQIDVGAPLTLGFSVTSNGAGWSRALSALEARRARDEPEPSVFYYGVLTPAASFAEYCTASCTLGVATIAEIEEVEYRAAIGLGFFGNPADPTATDTLAHELGHTLGRDHAPCGATDAGMFPYPDGSLGVWGFSAKDSLLIDPLRYRDVMGYCAPVWVSDFNYVALFDRLSAIAAEPLMSSPRANARSTYASVLVAKDRSLAWGSAIRRSLPQGRKVSIELLGERGVSIGWSEGRYHALSHDLGGAVLVAKNELSKAEIRAIRLPELSKEVLGLAEAPSLSER